MSVYAFPDLFSNPKTISLLPSPQRSQSDGDLPTESGGDEGNVELSMIGPPSPYGTVAVTSAASSVTLGGGAIEPDRFVTSDFKLEYVGRRGGTFPGANQTTKYYLGCDSIDPKDGALLVLTTDRRHAIEFRIDAKGRWRTQNTSIESAMNNPNPLPLYITIFGEQPSIGSLLILSNKSQHPKLSHIGGEGPISIVAVGINMAGFFIKCDLSHGGDDDVFATVGKGSGADKGAHSFIRIDQ